MGFIHTSPQIQPSFAIFSHNDERIMTALNAIMDCSGEMLGNLVSPFPDLRANHSRPEIFDGEIIINGVTLSQRVIEELRHLGIPLSWYNNGELLDAVNACHIDGQLIDDDRGINFRDMLTLTPRETLLRDKCKGTPKRHPLASDEEEVDCPRYCSL
jgi:hypothetical protein